MTWLDEQREQQNIDDYQSYKITLALKGRMTPTREGVIRLIKQKGGHHETLQDKKRKPTARGADDTFSTDTDNSAEFG